MPWLRLVLLAFVLTVCGRSLAADPVPTRLVPMDRFMQDAIGFPIGLSIPVPVEYEAAKLKDAPGYSSYWMKPDDVERAQKSGDLPADHGYMSGELSLNVGYDTRSGKFIGAEEPSNLAQIKAAFTDVKIDRFKTSGHPILMMSMVQKESHKRIYIAYIGSGKDENTVFISYRPPNENAEIGQSVWDQIKRALKSGG